MQLPAFSYDVTWKGYSEVVTQFNFSASKNFFLKNKPRKPTGVNFLLCIRYRVGETVYRYKLWSDVGEIGMDEIPLYTTQIIKKNFVLEVWSTDGETEASLSEALNIITSVVQVPTDLGSLTDVALATGEEFNNFIAQSGMAAVDLPGDLGSGTTGYYHWKSSGILDSGAGDCHQWSNEGSLQAAFDDFLPETSDNPQIVDGPIEGTKAIAANAINGSSSYMKARITGTSSFCLFVVFRIHEWSAEIPALFLYNFATANALIGMYFSTVNDGPPYMVTKAITAASAVSTSEAKGEIQEGLWGIACISCDDSYSTINFSQENSNPSSIVGFPALSCDRFRINDPGAKPLDIAEIVLYDGSGQTDGLDKIQQAWTHLTQKFALGIQMPVTFDDGAAWLDNE